ncbi:MAG TPA: prepilin-type N-terminal cleavage/methylation domain-containing protein [Gemmatimonadaceae bacterium]|nr:prepilin-type N-terminal cleavage/methylation domain-containing protein [Gemmatimonadaceae bacterium]
MLILPRDALARTFAAVATGDFADVPGTAARRRLLRRAFTIIELIAVTTVIGALAGLAVPRFRGVLERAKIAHAMSDLHTLQIELAAHDSLPDTLAGIGRTGMLDPWGFPYVYYKFPPGPGNPPGARKDRFLVPVNSTYDLYSIGPDGDTSAAFTASKSRDDVVRANDGDYLGLASKF